MSVKREKAYQLYLDGMKYTEIASALDLPLSTIKTWANRYFKTKKVSRQNEKVSKKSFKETNAKSSSNADNGKGRRVSTVVGAKKSDSDTQSPKARYGNKNAVGNKGGKGGPTGNNYRHVHGIYSLLSPTTLTDEEKAYLTDTEIDPVKEMEAAVLVCDILIARYMNKIAKFKEIEKVPHTLTEKITTVKGIERGEDSDYKQNDIGKSHVYTGELIDKLHAEIGKQVKIKAGLLKDIEELRLKSGSEANKNDAVLDDWVTAVLEGD